MQFKLWLENQLLPKIVSYNSTGTIVILLNKDKYAYETGDGAYVSNLYRKYFRLGFLPWQEFHKIQKISVTYKKIEMPDIRGKLQQKLFS